MKDRFKGNVLVALQFVLLAIIFISNTQRLFTSSALVDLASTVFALAGIAVLVLSTFKLGKSLTANPVPLAHGSLKTTGVYSLVRHPIYSALLLISMSKVMADVQVLNTLALFLLGLLLDYKARFEERLLIAKYENYAGYAARVGRLIPGIGKIRQS